MSSRIVRQIVACLALLLIAACSPAGSGGSYTAIEVENPDTGAVSNALARESSPAQVLDAHLQALNGCDWKGLMDQYPDNVELHLPDGNVLKGRQAVADLFVGFVKQHDQGGLCGLTFTEKSRQQVGGTLNVQWEANADFLAEPYRGSDAYVTDDGLMVAQVTTFDGAKLKFK
jgi:hypothetical protein